MTTTEAPTYGLNSRQRQHLRGLAHPLDPVVRIGRDGMTEAIVTKADQELEAHELIKIKVGDNCLEDVKLLVGSLAEQTQSENVQVIGRVGVLYRRRSKDPEIVLPPSRPSKE